MDKLKITVPLDKGVGLFYEEDNGNLFPGEEPEKEVELDVEYLMKQEESKPSEKEIKAHINNISAVFAMQGLDTSDEIKKINEEILKGQISIDEALKTMISNHGEEK